MWGKLPLLPLQIIAFMPYLVSDADADDGWCRSPSPEPVYNHEGKRTNTREVRTRKKLESERHRLVQKLLAVNPQYRPPYDYRSPHTHYCQSFAGTFVLICNKSFPGHAGT